MKPIIAFIPCIPPKATSQQKGAYAMPGGRGIRFFKKKHVAEAERDLVSLFMPYSPADPIQGPVRLSLHFVWPYRKSEKAKVVAAGHVVPNDKRPDIDNLAKMAIDAMTRCAYWEDDGQIASLTVMKSWHSNAGIEFSIAQL